MVPYTVCVCVCPPPSPAPCERKPTHHAWLIVFLFFFCFFRKNIGGCLPKSTCFFVLFVFSCSLSSLQRGTRLVWFVCRAGQPVSSRGLHSCIFFYATGGSCWYFFPLVNRRLVLWKPPACSTRGGREDFVFTSEISGTEDHELVVSYLTRTCTHTVVCWCRVDRLQGEMYNKVKVDDSFWTLEDGKEVSIALQKVRDLATGGVGGPGGGREWKGGGG